MNSMYSFPGDTPIHVRKKQVEIIQSKSNAEKLSISAEMIDFSYHKAISFLKKKHGTDDNNTIKFAFVKECYKNDFSEDELERIRLYFLNNNHQTNS